MLMTATVGGNHPETAVLKNILANAGIVAPHTGERYSEALLLGIGGGVGGGYWLFEFTGTPQVLVLGTRHGWQHPPGDFLKRVCERVGATTETKETGSRNVAARALDDALEAGKTPFIAVDLASMPYLELPDHLAKCFYHAVGVVGRDPITGDYLIDDRARVPLRADPESLGVARAAIASLKSRLIVVNPPMTEPDLVAAVRGGLADCREGMLNPPIRNFGLAAWEKWAGLVANPKDKKGWPKAFPPGPRLYTSLAGTYQAIEISGTGGGAMRPMYADFLDEAATITGDGALGDQAARWREIGAMWTDLAHTALSSSIEPFARARDLIDRKHQVFLARGVDALPEIRTFDEALSEIERLMEDTFPLTSGDVDDLLQDMRVRLQEIHEAESSIFQPTLP